MDILQAIETHAIVRALKSSFVVYPLINALHILAIGCLVTSVIMLDLRILGRFAEFDQVAFVRLLRRTALAAFAVALATGAAMFAVRATDYVANPAFLIKLGLIALAGANFLFITTVSGGGSAATTPTRLSAILSILVWPSVLVAGRFIGFI